MDRHELIDKVFENRAQSIVLCLIGAVGGVFTVAGGYYAIYELVTWVGAR